MRNATSAKPSTSVHILLVDDNKLGLSARKIVLEELGYRISPFTCAREALDHFTRHKFDLVITDYKMPRMDGNELIKHLRRERPEIPIILISGFADTLGLDEKSTGADIVIQKSNHEVANLIHSVDRLLNRKVPKKPARAQAAAVRAKSGTASSWRRES